MTEVWRRIPGWRWYEVSNLGRVRSLDRMVPGSRPCQGPRIMRGKILKTPLMKNGYPHLRLSEPGRRAQTVYVHHAVLAAFVGPRPPGLDEIRHLDGDKTNPRLENLAYGTVQENAADRKIHAVGGVAAA